MMGKQLVGQRAKEAMLIALAIKDKRIDWFVIHETGFESFKILKCNKCSCQ